MAEMLGYTGRRALMNARNVASAELAAAAAAMAAEGFVPEAVDFYARAGDMDALAALLSSALEDGDYFLFKRIASILGRPVDEKEWLALADDAERLGKLAFAGQARSRLEKKEQAG